MSTVNIIIPQLYNKIISYEFQYQNINNRKSDSVTFTKVLFACVPFKSVSDDNSLTCHASLDILLRTLIIILAGKLFCNG